MTFCLAYLCFLLFQLTVDGDEIEGTTKYDLQKFRSVNTDIFLQINANIANSLQVSRRGFLYNDMFNNSVSLIGNWKVNGLRLLLLYSSSLVAEAETDQT